MKMSLLQHKCLPTLSGMYECTVDKYTEIENEKGGYIEIVLNLPDRQFKYCVFPSQLDYVSSCLNRGLGVDRDTYSLGEALELIKKDKIEVPVWFSYNENYGRMNVSLHDTSLQDEAVTEDLI